MFSNSFFVENEGFRYDFDTISLMNQTYTILQVAVWQNLEFHLFQVWCSYELQKVFQKVSSRESRYYYTFDTQIKYFGCATTFGAT